MQSLIEQIRAVRRTASPLVAIATPDPSATLMAIRTALPEMKNGKQSLDGPLLNWDVGAGLVGLNEGGRQALLAQNTASETLADPVQMLRWINKVAEKVQFTPAGTIVIVHNLHVFFGKVHPLPQLIFNLRDNFKLDRRTFIMLAPFNELPIEIRSSFVTIEEPVQTDHDREVLIQSMATEAGLTLPAEKVRAAVDATRSLCAYTTEQNVAMALSKAGIDIGSLWEHTRIAIDGVPGLSMTLDRTTFDDLGGLTSIGNYVRDLKRGPNPPRLILHWDEIADSLAGSDREHGGGDSSGVAGDMRGTILDAWEEQKWRGILLLGPAGTGKTMIAKASAGELGVPRLKFDAGGTRDRLVGSSERNIREVIKTVAALAGPGGAFVIATCNDLSTLPPQMRRRFRSGRYFVDLPDAEEKAAIWRIQLASFGLPLDAERPNDEGWSSANIRDCCENAYDLGRSLIETARSRVIPAAVEDREGLDRLRHMAHDRLLSASYDGKYQLPQDVPAAATPGRRRAGMVD